MKIAYDFHKLFSAYFHKLYKIAREQQMITCIKPV